MVVPSISRSGTIHDTLLFLKPFCWDLWVAVLVSIIGTIASICFIRFAHNHKAQNGNEQSVNNKWYLIWIPTAAIFGHGEDELDNRSRLVLLVWFLGMSFMMGSYTASFNSLIMAEAQNRKVDLNANDVYIGYQSGSSIVRDLLLKKLRIDESRIKGYTTLEQYEKALSQGSSKGGVSAIVDETPYLKLFLAKYGSKYKLDGPSYKTEGFAFAFPMGSPLVSYMSKAIVNITKSGAIEEIQRKYFGVSDTFENQISTKCKFGFWSFSSLFWVKIILVILIFISMQQVRMMVYHLWPRFIWKNIIKKIKWTRCFHNHNSSKLTMPPSSQTQEHTNRFGSNEHRQDESSTIPPLATAFRHTNRLENSEHRQAESLELQNLRIRDGNRLIPLWFEFFIPTRSRFLVSSHNEHLDDHYNVERSNSVQRHVGLLPSRRVEELDT